MVPASQSRRPPTPFEAEGSPSRRSTPAAPADAFLFETAWEVCNQVGGIYQVVRSKVPLMVERWRDRYCLIGPYIAGKAQLEMEETAATGWLASAIQAVERAGLPVHHGHWLIEGRPRVLLLEHDKLGASLTELRQIIREVHDIPAPDNDPLMDAAILFGEAVRRMIQGAQEELERTRARR